MHCPNCGTQAETAQRFCRSCGLDLQAIQQMVARQLSGEKPAKFQPEQRARLAWQLFFGALIMFAGAALVAVDKRLDLGTWAGLIGLLLVIGGPLIALHAALTPVLYPQKTLRQKPQPIKQTAAHTTSKLALTPGAESVESVTEHTTRTLEPVASKPRESV